MRKKIFLVPFTAAMLIAGGACFSTNAAAEPDTAREVVNQLIDGQQRDRDYRDDRRDRDDRRHDRDYRDGGKHKKRDKTPHDNRDGRKHDKHRR